MAQETFNECSSDIAHKKIFNKMNFHFDPRDMRGPSFHFAYDLENGFSNYEEVSKNELLERLPSTGCLLDVGANIGLFSAYFALKKNEIQIVSFEPDKTAFRCLERNMKQFDKHRVSLFNKALGKDEEKKELYKSATNDGGHSLLAEQPDQKVEIVRTGQVVSVVNYDQLVQSNQAPLPDVIKIDVEGFEHEVLRGLVETIRRSKPPMLIESSNSDFAKKGPLWQILTSFEDLGIYSRVPGKTKRMTMQELHNHAQGEIAKDKKMNNYFFEFS